MATLIDIQVAAGPASTTRPRASWLVAASASSDMFSMSGAAGMATYRDACAPANAAAKGLAIHGANGRKPFTRRPEEPPI